MNAKDIRKAARDLFCTLGFHSYETRRARTSVVLNRCRHCGHEMYHLSF
jgi:hypothetical protein